jgi:hypothetical protein
MENIGPHVIFQSILLIRYLFKTTKRSLKSLARKKKYAKALKATTLANIDAAVKDPRLRATIFPPRTASSQDKLFQIPRWKLFPF